MKAWHVLSIKMQVHFSLTSMYGIYCDKLDIFVQRNQFGEIK